MDDHTVYTQYDKHIKMGKQKINKDQEIVIKLMKRF